MWLLSGCTAVNSALAPRAYDGPGLPREEVAVVTTRYVEDLYVIWGTVTKILAVDGKDWGSGYAAELRPGRHDLVLGRGTGGGYVYTRTRDTSETLSFEAEANHVYLALSTWIDGRAWFWIEDEATGDPIAGDKPPTPG